MIQRWCRFFDLFHKLLVKMYKCAFWNQFKQLFSTCWLWLLSMVKQLYIFQIANMYFLMGVFILKVAWQEISPRQTT